MRGREGGEVVRHCACTRRGGCARISIRARRRDNEKAIYACKEILVGN